MVSLPGGRPLETLVRTGGRGAPVDEAAGPDVMVEDIFFRVKERRPLRNKGKIAVDRRIGMILKSCS